MIRINFNPQKLTGQLQTEWLAWQKKAEAATDDVIQAWEDWRASGSPGDFKYEFDEKVWGELKDWLVKNVFHNKCAYCETREVRSPYHAEHFRPKAKVTIKIAGKKKQQVCKALDEFGQHVKHPGYFWLAYTWSNLLPSCNYCNTALGKKNQFPINNTHVSVRLLKQDEVTNLTCPRIKSKDPSRGNVYYLQPEDLSVMEDPLLLHPYLDDPCDHLVFGEFGVVTPRDGSKKGEHSIAVYNLDSEALTTARQIAQENALRDYGDEITRGKNRSYQDRITGARAVIAGYISGEEPYSAAVMANLRLFFSTHGLPTKP